MASQISEAVYNILPYIPDGFSGISPGSDLPGWYTDHRVAFESAVNAEAKDDKEVASLIVAAVGVAVGVAISASGDKEGFKPEFELKFPNGHIVTVIRNLESMKTPDITTTYDDTWNEIYKKDRDMTWLKEAVIHPAQGDDEAALSAGLLFIAAVKVGADAYASTRK